MPAICRHILHPAPDESLLRIRRAHRLPHAHHHREPLILPHERPHLPAQRTARPFADVLHRIAVFRRRHRAHRLARFARPPNRPHRPRPRRRLRLRIEIRPMLRLQRRHRPREPAIARDARAGETEIEVRVVSALPHHGHRTSIIMMSAPGATFSPYHVARTTEQGASKSSATSGRSSLRMEQEAMMRMAEVFMLWNGLTSRPPCSSSSHPRSARRPHRTHSCGVVSQCLLFGASSRRRTIGVMEMRTYLVRKSSLVTTSCTSERRPCLVGLVLAMMDSMAGRSVKWVPVPVA